MVGGFGDRDGVLGQVVQVLADPERAGLEAPGRGLAARGPVRALRPVEAG